MTNNILLRTEAHAKPVSINDIDVGIYSKYGCVTLKPLKGDPVQIISQVKLLYDLFLKLAEKFKPSQQWQSLPDDPYIAWPMLVKRYPWIFDGIDLSKEPYAHYLKGRQSSGPGSQLNQDLAKVAHLVDPRLADIAEVLTGSRQYGGSALVRRLKAVQEALALK
jgi:hypothetical protein